MSKRPASKPNAAATRLAKVIDLAGARHRSRIPIDGRQALVLTLVEQLSALVRGTTSPAHAGAVRRAASHALDVLDRVEDGEADPDEARQACREVEALLRHSKH